MWSNKQSILILDFGSQYTQLIARRVREQAVYSEIHPFNLSIEKIRALAPAGIVLSGGPSSVYDVEAPRISPEIFELGIPILGICYGVQLACHMLGGKVTASTHREYGRAQVRLEATASASTLFAGFDVGQELAVWMSHGDRVDALPTGFEVVGTSPSCPFAAVEAPGRKFWGVQFHPEVVHTPRGGEVLSNFLFRICGVSPTWTMANFVDEAVGAVAKQVGKGRAICGLSGGVDS
ncbi:MAG TPA: glutamine-hydrolyzing GMP synthase, partial [Polyangia bacterium]